MQFCHAFDQSLHQHHVVIVSDPCCHRFIYTIKIKIIYDEFNHTYFPLVQQRGKNHLSTFCLLFFVLYGTEKCPLQCSPLLK